MMGTVRPARNRVLDDGHSETGEEPCLEAVLVIIGGGGRVLGSLSWADVPTTAKSWVHSLTPP